MTCYLSPLGNSPQVDTNGDPLSGGLINTYLAGTSTPAATYTDDTGGTPHANPIVLNSRGVPASPIWLQGGTAYKFVITDAQGNTLAPTLDDITGINDPAVTSSTDEWVRFTGTPTYVSATSFSLAGDHTSTFQAKRRVRTVNTGGTIYGMVTSSAYNAGTGLSTITVTNDSGALDSGLSAVSYGFLSATNPSVPFYTGQVLQVVSSTDGGTTTTSATLANITASAKSITPKSTNSTFIVECSVQASVTASGAGVNSVGGFRLYNNTAAADIGTERAFGTSSAAGANLQTEGPIMLRASVANTGRTAVAFVLRARQATGTPTVGGLNQVWTITEVQG